MSWKKEWHIHERVDIAFNCKKTFGDYSKFSSPTTTSHQSTRRQSHVRHETIIVSTTKRYCRRHTDYWRPSELDVFFLATINKRSEQVRRPGAKVADDKSGCNGAWNGMDGLLGTASDDERSSQHPGSKGPTDKRGKIDASKTRMELGLRHNDPLGNGVMIGEPSAGKRTPAESSICTLRLSLDNLNVITENPIQNHMRNTFLHAFLGDVGEELV
uniref:Uncharacterized protein n=1 Tax=Steinernema glaseri TaxID=37863 RepID=A0A1I7XZ90_9BILA